MNWDSKVLKGLYKLAAGIAFLLIVALAGGVGQGVTKELLGKDEKGLSNKILMQISSEINKNTPMMVDKDTRLDNTIGINNKITYMYTLINVEKDELDIDALNNEFSVQLKNKVCSSKDLEIFLKDGVTLVYSYSDKNGLSIKKFNIKPAECGY